MKKMLFLLLAITLLMTACSSNGNNNLSEFDNSELQKN